MKRKQNPFEPILTPSMKIKQFAIKLTTVGVLGIPVFIVASTCIMTFKTQPWGIGDFKPFHYSLMVVPDNMYRDKMKKLQYSDQPDKEYSKSELAVGRDERLAKQRQRMAFNH